MLCSDKKFQTCATCNKIVDSHRYNIEMKETPPQKKKNKVVAGCLHLFKIQKQANLHMNSNIVPNSQKVEITTEYYPQKGIYQPQKKKNEVLITC